MINALSFYSAVCAISDAKNMLHSLLVNSVLQVGVVGEITDEPSRLEEAR
jgi:hypothetical protein